MGWEGSVSLIMSSTDFEVSRLCSFHPRAIQADKDFCLAFVVGETDKNFFPGSVGDSAGAEGLDQLLGLGTSCGTFTVEFEAGSL